MFKISENNIGETIEIKFLPNLYDLNNNYYTLRYYIKNETYLPSIYYCYIYVNNKIKIFKFAYNYFYIFNEYKHINFFDINCKYGLKISNIHLKRNNYNNYIDYEFEIIELKNDNKIDFNEIYKLPRLDYEFLNFNIEKNPTNIEYCKLYLNNREYTHIEYKNYKRMLKINKILNGK